MNETIETNATPRQDTQAVSAKPRLLDQMRQVIRAKHYSLRTEKTYISWASQFIRWTRSAHSTACMPEQNRAKKPATAGFFMLSLAVYFNKHSDSRAMQKLY